MMRWAIGLVVFTVVGCGGGVGTEPTDLVTTPIVAPTVAETRREATAVMVTETSPTPAETAVLLPTGAGDADVLFVRAVQTDVTTWTFAVTVQHPDTGWEDYADGWSVFLPDGTVVKPDPDSPFTRLLLHPHENEQPFTRSQSGLNIPAGVDWVQVQAHDLVDGWGGKAVIVALTSTAGVDFETELLAK